MNQQELLQSLSTEQGAALNAILEENFSLRGNATELKTTREELSTVQAQLDKVLAVYEQAKEALASGDVDTLKAIHREVEKPAVQREIESIGAQIADLQEKQNALSSQLS